MGKIVKYCSNCEESFAEKFSFCPNCAQAMTAFEMNPVSSGNGGDTVLGKQAGQTVIEGKKPVEEANILDLPVEKPTVEAAPEPEPIVAAPTVMQTTPKIESEKIGDTKIFTDSNQTQTYNLADIEELGTIDAAKSEEASEEVEEVKEIVAEPETKTFAAATGGNGNGDYRTQDFQTNYSSSVKDDDGFHITVIEEKNSKQRNGLLLGTMVIMVAVALGSAVFSIFNKDFGIGSIGSDDALYLAVNDVAPVEIEEQEPPKPNKDEGGGGGGGGKNESEPASKGRLVSQSEKPINPPDAKLVQITNPDIKIIQETQGKIKRPITEERAGLPGSDNLNPSNGPGRGGGLGGGTGTGLGGGNGTGEGNGDGSGSGNGKGNGNGNGIGPGDGPPPPPPKAPEPKPVGPTETVKILSRPQPRYTDAARTNNVTGTVTLKVTFMANGTIGSITPVSGLPYGLTEQAIAAAKSIRFEPAKRGGVPYGVSKTVTYNFTIY